MQPRITKHTAPLRRPADTKARKVSARELVSLLNYTTTLGTEGKVAAEPRDSLSGTSKIRAKAKVSPATSAPQPQVPETPVAANAKASAQRVRPRELNDLLDYGHEVFHDLDVAKNNAAERSLPAPPRVRQTKAKAQPTEQTPPANVAWERFVESTALERWGDATLALYLAHEYWTSMRNELLKVASTYKGQDPDLFKNVHTSIAKMSDLINGSKNRVDPQVWRDDWKTFTTTRGSEGFTAGLKALQGLGDDIRAKYHNVVGAAEALGETDAVGAELVLRSAKQALSDSLIH